MDLSAVIAAYGTPDFDEKLRDTLNENAMDLPLEDACEHGGWPDPEDVDVYSVANVHDVENAIYATVSIAFTESVGTTCANAQVPFHHDVTCQMKIEKSGDDWSVEIIEEEHEPEF